MGTKLNSIRTEQEMQQACKQVWHRGMIVTSGDDGQSPLLERDFDPLNFQCCQEKKKRPKHARDQNCFRCVTDSSISFFFFFIKGENSSTFEIRALLHLTKEMKPGETERVSQCQSAQSVIRSGHGTEASHTRTRREQGHPGRDTSQRRGVRAPLL